MTEQFYGPMPPTPIPMEYPWRSDEQDVIVFLRKDPIKVILKFDKE